MNKYYLAQKIKFLWIRWANKIKRFFKGKKPQGKYIKESANTDEKDFIDFFSPQPVYLLAIKEGPGKAIMAPVKWITTISKDPPMVAVAFKDGRYLKAVRRRKAFTLAAIHKDYIEDTARMINAAEPRIARFAAEPAFFIDGYKAKRLPWAECRADKFLKLPGNQALITARILHISKKALPLTERVIHYKDKLFLNNKRISTKKHQGPQEEK